MNHQKTVSTLSENVTFLNDHTSYELDNTIMHDNGNSVYLIRFGIDQEGYFCDQPSRNTLVIEVMRQFDSTLYHPHNLASFPIPIQNIIKSSIDQFNTQFDT